MHLRRTQIIQIGRTLQAEYFPGSATSIYKNIPSEAASDFKRMQVFHMRWHFVGGIIASLISLFYIAVGLMMVSTIVYYNVRYGPIEYSYGRYESLDKIALTWKNYLGCSLTLLVGTGAGAAALCWFKQKNRYGTLLFLISMGLAGVAAAILR
ncbi:hypothetical protein V6x_37720 [Gimesia chilikensis]|uniref:Uncharacterized protein n=2 Tax=Gimesia chilikensis TaxID=2605989 RepID=A0A517WFM6_9PLAN|nr:hypothetical protein V6x_37720 [Gimesia chilikensis]